MRRMKSPGNQLPFQLQIGAPTVLRLVVRDVTIKLAIIKSQVRASLQEGEQKIKENMMMSKTRLGCSEIGRACMCLCDLVCILCDIVIDIHVRVSNIDRQT